MLDLIGHGVSSDAFPVTVEYNSAGEATVGIAVKSATGMLDLMKCVTAINKHFQVCNLNYKLMLNGASEVYTRERLLSAPIPNEVSYYELNRGIMDRRYQPWRESFFHNLLCGNKEDILSMPIPEFEYMSEADYSSYNNDTLQIAQRYSKVYCTPIRTSTSLNVKGSVYFTGMVRPEHIIKKVDHRKGRMCLFK